MEILYYIAGGLTILVGLSLMFIKLYTKATTHLSFVRTGAGGKKVILEGGAFVIPGLHETTNVNMQTVKISIERKRDMALTTKDKLRADVKVDFHIKVSRDKDAISKAAQTLAEKTLDPRALQEIIEEKLVGAMRATASIMEMTELHEKRTDFIQKIKDSIAQDLSKNGLELESVSLSGLNQTAKEYFDPDNIFDAEGLVIITKTVEEKKKIKNDIERDNEVKIANKNLEAKTISLSVKQKEAERESEQKTAIEKKKTEEEQKREEAIIIKNQTLEEAQNEKEKKVEESKLDKEKTIELKKQQNEIDISEKVAEESQAKAKANEAKAIEVESEEKIKTVREVAEANKKKDLAIIEAKQEAESQSTEKIVAAEAETIAAKEKAEALKITSESEATAILVKVEAQEKDYSVRAEGEKKLNEAENSISETVLENKLKLALIENMPNIIKSMTAPMENIDSIKIVDMGGNNNALINNQEAGNLTNNLPDQIVNSALKYKVTTPLMENMLKDVGLDINSYKGITAPLNDIIDNKESSEEVLKEDNKSKKEEEA